MVNLWHFCDFIFLDKDEFKKIQILTLMLLSTLGDWIHVLAKVMSYDYLNIAYRKYKKNLEL